MSTLNCLQECLIKPAFIYSNWCADIPFSKQSSYVTRVPTGSVMVWVVAQLYIGHVFHIWGGYFAERLCCCLYWSEYRNILIRASAQQIYDRDYGVDVSNLSWRTTSCTFESLKWTDLKRILQQSPHTSATEESRQVWNKGFFSSSEVSHFTLTHFVLASLLTHWWERLKTIFGYPDDGMGQEHHYYVCHHSFNQSINHYLM